VTGAPLARGRRFRALIHPSIPCATAPPGLVPAPNAPPHRCHVQPRNCGDRAQYRVQSIHVARAFRVSARFRPRDLRHRAVSAGLLNPRSEIPPRLLQGHVSEKNPHNPTPVRALMFGPSLGWLKSKLEVDPMTAGTENSRSTASLAGIARAACKSARAVAKLGRLCFPAVEWNLHNGEHFTWISTGTFFAAIKLATRRHEQEEPRTCKGGI
jgi:hypothetical protein